MRKRLEEMNVYKWIDSFIPELLFQRTEDLFRARAFVQYVLVYLVLCIAVLLAMYASPDRSVKALLMTLSTTAPLCLFFMLLLFILRHTANLLLCARLLLFLSAVSCLMGLMVTGGVSLSPLNPMLFLPMVMTVCMLGLKEGSVWMLCIALVYLALWLLELQAVLLPVQLMEEQHMRSNTTFIWLLTAICIWVIVAAYERMNYVLAVERDDHNRRLEILASTDELTGIANRRTFELVLNNTLKRNRRYKTRFALFYLDLDDFKSINDRHGHVVGDEILVLAAQRLQASLRDMDLVARIGGDEFAIVVDNVAIEEQAQQLQEKILAFFVEPMQTSGGAIQVHISIGFSIYPDTAECSENLRIQADRAMYSCKDNRKKCAASAL